MSTSSSKIAFVFPGQGSQKVGMGKALYEASPEGRAVFEAADAVLGEPLSALCFDGPEDDLKLTRNTQPAVLANSIALLRALGERPDVVAGHSLGEYSANVAAETLSLEAALPLVRLRGEFMQEAVPVGEGAMAAVMAKTASEVDAVCEATEGVVKAVNYNSPGQTVIAGATAAVAAAGEALKQSGAKVIALPVSAPFHSPLMQPAEAQLTPHLQRLPFGSPVCPIYTNVDAAATRDGDAARDALIRQVSRPVRWEEIVRQMAGDGVGLVVEFGEGKTLTSLIRRISKEIQRVNVQGPEDLDAAREAIATFRQGGVD